MAKHRTVIESDEPIEVHVGGGDGRWFRLWHAIVESGQWAALTGSAKAVLVVLAKHADDQWVAWPSVSTLQATAGTKRTQTYEAISELELAGLLIRRTRGGGRQSTTYQLVEPVVVEREGVRPTGRVGSGSPDGRGPADRTQLRLIEQDSCNSSAAAAAERALVEAEVGEPVRSRLLSDERISADLVRRVHESCRASGKGVGAVVNGIRAALQAEQAKAAKRKAVEATSLERRQAEAAEREAVESEASAAAAWCDRLLPGEAARMVDAVTEHLPAVMRESTRERGLSARWVRLAVWHRFGASQMLPEG